jgi:hypothetical protein
MLERNQPDDCGGTEDDVAPSPFNQDDNPDIVDLTFARVSAEVELARSLGMVVDLELIDGSKTSGVLGAVGADVLVLEHWDAGTSAPTGKPFTVSVQQVRRVIVP